jgi:uncharacterized protein YkwD
MGKRNYFHTLTQEPVPEGQPGRTHQDRITAAGYTGWTFAIENIAAGNMLSKAQLVFDLWSDAPQYHQNMIDPNITQVGIGMAYVPGGSNKYLWTVDFSNGNDGPPGC